MSENSARLGICFFNHQLFYAVQACPEASFITRIGAIDFNFDIDRALLDDDEKLQGVRDNILSLKERFDAQHFRLLLSPHQECWATLPKLVYDNSQEREAYINILMGGHKRSAIHPSWHRLSKDHFKLLQLRTDSSLRGVQTLTAGMPSVEFMSAFEVGGRWISHAHPGGSFLTVGVFAGGISVSSFILGKLRGATYIAFDAPEDLPYLWLQKAEDLTWMRGLHEQIQLYGDRSHRIIDILKPFWDEAAEVTKMDSLQKMQISADETTYGFDLALAYPAVMLATG